MVHEMCTFLCCMQGTTRVSCCSHKLQCWGACYHAVIYSGRCKVLQQQPQLPQTIAQTLGEQQWSILVCSTGAPFSPCTDLLAAHSQTHRPQRARAGFSQA